MPQPVPAPHDKARNQTLVAISTATQSFLYLSRCQVDAAAKGDLEEVGRLNGQLLRILDHRSSLIRDFAYLTRKPN